jgi:hypothetical protein
VRLSVALLGICLIAVAVAVLAYRTLPPFSPEAAARTVLSRMPSHAQASTFHPVLVKRIRHGIFLVYEVKRDALPEAVGGGYPGGEWMGAVVVRPGVLGTWHVSGATPEVALGTVLPPHANLAKIADASFAVDGGIPYQRAPNYGLL